MCEIITGTYRDCRAGKSELEGVCGIEGIMQPRILEPAHAMLHLHSLCMGSRH